MKNPTDKEYESKIEIAYYSTFLFIIMLLGLQLMAAVAQDRVVFQVNDQYIAFYQHAQIDPAEMKSVLVPIVILDIQLIETITSPGEGTVPIHNASIEIINLKTGEKKRLDTFMGGAATFEIAPYTSYSILIEKEGYLSKQIKLATNEFNYIEWYTMEVMLDKPERLIHTENSTSTGH